jgi:geranylgeranyl diphosphate synthase type II
MQGPDELRDVLEERLASLDLTPELGELQGAVRYSLEGGKRIRGVLCLATAEAAGGEVSEALDAAAGLELVHAFSLVHDDLPAMDDDDERRGRASTHVAYGEGVALLAGDAMLAEAFRLVLASGSADAAQELATATLGMIGGQYLDITIAHADLAELHRLKTGRLFAAAVGLGLWAAGVPAAVQAPWRVFAEELGLLFQLVDDVLDGDGYAALLGPDEARRLAADAAERARARLGAIPADTSVLADIVAGLAVRTA